MVRRKGEVTKPYIDRGFRHQVRILVPEGGLRSRNNEMEEFCQEWKFHTHGGPKTFPRVHAVHFCFAEISQAEAFHARFGGERVEVPERIIEQAYYMLTK